MFNLVLLGTGDDDRGPHWQIEEHGHVDFHLVMNGYENSNMGILSMIHRIRAIDRNGAFCPGTPSDFLENFEIALLLFALLPSAILAAEPSGTAIVPDARQAGGEPDGIIQVANLVYAGTKSSRCFADHFLVRAEQDSAISTSRRFHAVKLRSDSIYEFPLLIMTGEGVFRLSDAERENLRRYVERGGLLLASAGCSSTEWDRSFRYEMAVVFPKQPLKPIATDHPLFHTVYDIDRLEARHGTPRPIQAVSIGGRVGVVYSTDGLNDTQHTTGCCCCGGNELSNAEQINVNILAYALTY